MAFKGKGAKPFPAAKASTKTPTSGMIGGKANVPASQTRDGSKGSGAFPAFKKGGKAK